MNHLLNQQRMVSQSYQKGWQKSLNNLDVFDKVPGVATQKNRSKRPVVMPPVQRQ